MVKTQNTSSEHPSWVIIISAIKEKKELSALDDDYVGTVLENYFRQFPKTKKNAENWNPRSQACKTIIKEVRARLREVYGVFQKEGFHKRKELLYKYEQAKGKGEKLKILDTLLRTHQSTLERVDHYPGLYKTLFLSCGKPKSILDLGCGFNPLSYQWLGCEPKYTASDISTEDMALVKEFFRLQGSEGVSRRCNLLDEQERHALFDGHWDVVFMFKLVDTLESQKRHSSKFIISELRKKCKTIIISFPTVSIGGRTFREGEKENWFSSFLKKEQFTWTTHTVPGEEFWILRCV